MFEVFSDYLALKICWTCASASFTWAVKVNFDLWVGQLFVPLLTLLRDVVEQNKETCPWERQYQYCNRYQGSDRESLQEPGCQASPFQACSCFHCKVK